MSKTNRTKRAAGILYRTQQKTPRYLLLKRQGSGLWALPGGELKPKEGPWMAAQRETLEEIGTVPQYALGINWRTVTHGGVKYTTYLMEVRYPFPCRLNWEHTDWGWFTHRQVVGLETHPGLWLTGLL